MGDEGPKGGVHEEWLTAEIARLEANRRGVPSKIALIASLRTHTGLGLREAARVVDDCGRRHGLAEAWASAGRSPVASALMLVVFALLGYASVSGLCSTLDGGHERGSTETLWYALMLLGSVAGLSFEVRDYLRTRRRRG
jgi:hypothetical protein